VNTLALPLLGIAGLGASVAIFRRPALGAALILLVVNFEGVLDFGGVSAVKLLSIFCVGVLALRFVMTGAEIEVDRTTWLIVIFGLWVGTTVFWSAGQSGALSPLISFYLQSAMYLLIINLVRSKSDLKLALWGYVIGGSILAVILGEWMINIDFRRNTSMEVAGLGLNMAARMVGLNLLLAVVLFQLERRSLARLALVGIAVLSGISSILALSRGNWYGVIVSTAAFAFVVSMKKGFISTVKQGLLVAAVGSIALYAASTFMLSDYGMAKLGERFESAYTFSDGASGRFGIWRTVMLPFLDRPLVGHGFNSFKLLNEWKNAGAHNAFVWIAVESGLVGVALFLVILGSVALVLWRKLRERDANSVVLGWGVGLLVFLVTVSGVDTSVNRKYLWFVLGIITLLAHHYGRHPGATGQEEVVEEVAAGHEGPRRRFPEHGHGRERRAPTPLGTG
jgi:O-antigen ligase